MDDNASPTPRTPPTEPAWLLLTYKVPSQSSRARVAVWRDLKRLGALYLQQAVCVLPDVADVAVAVASVRQRIADLSGTSFSGTLSELSDSDQTRLVDGFRANSAREYAEIVEECETKFFKEIEFERFRKNYTYEEAEEIGQDLEKLRRWLGKAIARDWMGASGRREAEERVARSGQMLEDFENDVFERSGQAGDDVDGI